MYIGFRVHMIGMAKYGLIIRPKIRETKLNFSLLTRAILGTKFVRHAGCEPHSLHVETLLLKSHVFKVC